jgi:hypothetical protein
MQAALEKLHQSHVVVALRDPRLQRILRAIDASANPAEALEGYRQASGREFSAFLDVLLIALGAAEQDESGAVTFTGLSAH